MGNERLAPVQKFLGKTLRTLLPLTMQPAADDDDDDDLVDDDDDADDEMI